MKTALPNVDAKKTAAKLQSFILSVCKKEKMNKVLIAISGGVDSATSATLTVKALGKNNVYPVLLPYGTLNKQGEKDA